MLDAGIEYNEPRQGDPLTPIERRVLEKAWERMGSASDPLHPGFFICNHIQADRWEALRAALFNES